MGNFFFESVQENGYNGFLLWLSSESILEHLGEIKEYLKNRNFCGKIVVDQLFLTGNSNNRFACCEYFEGNLQFDDIRPVQPADFFREKSVRFLHENYAYVENSILTEEQKEKIKDNIPF